MKGLLRLAARLYPKRWRERYARELDALIDDIDASPTDLWSVVYGALTMRIMNLGLIPVGLAVAGALVGTIVSLRQPTLYESSATVRLQSRDTDSVKDVLDGMFGHGLRRDLVVHPDRLMVMIDSGRKSQGTAVLRFASLNENAAAAQQTTQRIMELVAKGMASRTTPVTFETLAPPTLPTEPSRPNHLALAGSGGGIGLIVGGLVSWLRRRSARKA